MKTMLTVAAGLLAEGLICSWLSDASDNQTLRALAPMAFMLLVSGAVLLVLCVGAQIFGKGTSVPESLPPGSDAPH